MNRSQQNWGVALTPARPNPRRSGEAEASHTAGGHVEPGEIIEAIEKLSDLVRRIDAKVDALDERLNALSTKLARPPRTRAAAPAVPALPATPPAEAVPPSSATATGDESTP